MVVQPKIRGFICITAHPEGCAANIREQIDYVKKQPRLNNGPRKVLIIGASTGYGLSTRILTAFGAGASTLGVFFERPSDRGRPASAGWYNSAAFHRAAHAEGLYAKSINGDAFSPDIKKQTIELLKKDLGQVDMVIYSLAAPRRTDPVTGEVYKSVLKPVGQPFTNKSVDTDRQVVEEVTLEPASERDIHDTIKVMGGEDWELWMEALKEADALTPDALTLAYSYIGPELTYPIYRHGTIGHAKEHLEASAKSLQSRGFSAYVSVNKAVVTQASSAIPVVPLYLAALMKQMAARNVDEGCIEQICRLFHEKLKDPKNPVLDREGRIRIDDWEMREDIQQAVRDIWPSISTETLFTHTDFGRYQEEFLKLFGFGIKGIDYDQDVEIDVPLP